MFLAVLALVAASHAVVAEPKMSNNICYTTCLLSGTSEQVCTLLCGALTYPLPL